METDIAAEENQLPPYPGISPADVLIIRSAVDAASVRNELLAADALGFDTESRPVFQKGQASDGPHLIQLATEQRAYLFPATSALQPEVLNLLQEVLVTEHIVKIGFGLHDDLKHLRSKLGLEAVNIVDLARALRPRKGKDVGVKTAVAEYLGMQMHKSKKTSTSNWAASELSERQQLYAANDAQAALLVYRQWQKRTR
jgi:RNA polymerase sigma factor for flagellar operon FliA